MPGEQMGLRKTPRLLVDHTKFINIKIGLNWSFLFRVSLSVSESFTNSDLDDIYRNSLLKLLLC